MKDQLNPKTISLTLASVSVIMYLLCAALIAAAPQTTLILFSYLFHGIDITKIADFQNSFSSVVIGTIETAVYTLAAGWLFATIYNYINKKIK